jgi:hypothetical protein
MSDPLPKLSDDDLRNIAKVLFYRLPNVTGNEALFSIRLAEPPDKAWPWEVIDAEMDRTSCAESEAEAVAIASALNRLARYG